MDYSTFKYAKPPPTKRKKAKNNKRPTDQDRCVICSQPYAELHEIYYGVKHRQLSIKYGMQIRLCLEHHRGQNGVHNNKTFDVALKREYQQKFEKSYSREKFIEIFGRNYLESEVA